MSEVLPVGGPVGPRGGTRALSAALVGVLLATCATGCRTPAPPPRSSEAAASFPVGAPDQLLISILPEPAIERSVVVRPDGMITVDLIGDVPAQGRTTQEIAADVENRMARFKRGATATVFLANASSTGITILGEVNGPSSFPLTKTTRLSEAIGSVGGPTLFAWASRIRIIRSNGSETVVFRADLNAIQAGDRRTDIELASGDIIYVPPTVLARLGYAINALLFPFRPFLGLATSAAGAAIAR